VDESIRMANRAVADAGTVRKWDMWTASATSLAYQGAVAERLAGDQALRASEYRTMQATTRPAYEPSMSVGERALRTSFAHGVLGQGFANSYVAIGGTLGGVPATGFSLAYNLREGNRGDAAIDAGFLAASFVPGGAVLGVLRSERSVLLGALNTEMRIGLRSDFSISAGLMPEAHIRFVNAGDVGTTISGAASSAGRQPAMWGKTPQATEFLYVQNRTSPLSIESALSQADEFGAFSGNLVEHEVLRNGSVRVDHGGGLVINYRGMPDETFDAFHGPGLLAAYRTPREFPSNQLISWDDAFDDGIVNVHIRQSTLMSDRSSVAAFSHEYGELRMIHDRVGDGSYSVGKWDSFVKGAHERIVPAVDNIIGHMIISGGK